MAPLRGLRARAPRSAGPAPRSCGTGRTTRRPATAARCRRAARARRRARRRPPSSRSARSGRRRRARVSMASAASPIVRTIRALRPTGSAQRREVAVLVAAAEDQDHAARRYSPRATSPWRPRWSPWSRRPSARRPASATSSAAVRQALEARQRADDRLGRRRQALGRGERGERVLDVVSARKGEPRDRHDRDGCGVAMSDDELAPRRARPPWPAPDGRPRREKSTRSAAVGIASECGSSALTTAKSPGPCRAKEASLGGRVGGEVRHSGRGGPA